MKPRAFAPRPLRTEPLRRGALRSVHSTFIGRARELAALWTHVEDGAQLITLLGPPGIGKTRFALEAARDVEGDATFCDLSEARDDAALLLAAALALGVSVEAPMANEVLAALVGRALHVRGEALLVLDNAEQVASGVANAVSLWMDAAPSALFLVTSRERLRMGDEHVLEIGPLDFPARSETSPERLLACEAVTLLVDRAHGARSSFTAAREDAGVLAEIVRRVEGVPLAIELCAARLGMLAPAQLLARLEQRLDVLASDRRGVSERQATLRGAIDWSWNLLDGCERSVLAQCSVFRGGFDLDAAEAILTIKPSELVALDVLSSLHDKSLLAVGAAEGRREARRYRLYESVREYADEKLIERDHGIVTRDRHARYFVEAGARWAAFAKDHRFQEGLAALACESDNLLAAREHTLARGDHATAIEALLCLEPLAIVRGPVVPYLELLEATLRLAATTLPPALESRARGSLGIAESRRGRPIEAVAHFTRAVDLCAATRDHASLPFLLAKRANQRGVLGEHEAAAADFHLARSLLDQHDDPAVRGVYCRHYAFFLWRAGHVEEARREGERARDLLQQHGDRRELAYVLCDLAASYLDTAELDAATTSLGLAIDLLRRLRYRRVESRCLLLFALAKRERGLFVGAEADLQRALQLHTDDGDRGAEGFALWHLACLALERDDAATARHLGEQALVRYVEIGDGHLIAHARMVLGAALARLGEPDAAASEMARAASLLASTASPAVDTLALLQAQIPLARAAAALIEGDPSRAAVDVADAARVLADVDARAGAIPVASVRFARRVLVSALVAAVPPRRSPSPAPPIEAQLVIGDDGRWFRLAEQREVSLERRAALRRILAALAHRRVESPASALPLDGILEAGWPGERVSVEAGAARVYNAIQRLRRLGLDSVLRTRDDGYLLDPETSTCLAVGASGARRPSAKRS